MPEGGQASTPSPAASFVSDHPSEPTRRQCDDEKNPNCPRCNAQFTNLFRRHHCRACNGLVCDSCSKHRLRVHGYKKKERVCDSCASSMGKDHVAGIEEDLSESSGIVKQLQAALLEMSSQSDDAKRVLLELEAHASGDGGKRLEAYEQDPGNEAHSFERLQERVQQLWSRDMLQQLEVLASERSELEERKRKCMEWLDESQRQERALSERWAGLDADRGAMATVEGQRDQLVRDEVKLMEAVSAVRFKVRELEMERQDHEQRQAQREALTWGIGSFLRRSSSGSGAAGASGEAVPYALSAGRQNALLDGRAAAGRGGRLEGCRQLCVLM